MKIENAVALVTGANRGIGLAFAHELLARGARKVDAAARDPATINQPGGHPLRLDVNRPDEIATAAGLAQDVTLVIIPKSSPVAIVKQALDGLDAGHEEVLADDITLHVKHGLTARRHGCRPCTADALPRTTSGSTPSHHRKPH